MFGAVSSKESMESTDSRRHRIKKKIATLFHLRGFLYHLNLQKADGEEECPDTGINKGMAECKETKELECHGEMKGHKDEAESERTMGTNESQEAEDSKKKEVYKEVQKDKGSELMTMKKLSESWIKEKEFYLKESSLVRYKSYLNCHILPEFGDMGIGEINNELVRDFCERLLRSGGKKGSGLSQKTVAETFRVLKGLRKYALDTGYEAGFKPDCFKVKSRKKPIRILSTSERETLSSYLKCNPSPENTAILMDLYTGMRLGELCALKWSEVDLKNGEIRITNTLQRIKDESDSPNKTKIIRTSPKTLSSMRTIPIPEAMLPLIREASVTDSFFVTRNAHFADPRTLQNHFKKILKECGIKDANFHALRHSFASFCIESGVDPKTLSEILGHSNVNITLNLYVHTTMDAKRKQMSKLTL